MNNPSRPTGWNGDPIRSPSLAEIDIAVERLAGTIVRTPLLAWHDTDANIFLKPEVLQPTGSYKVRGVLNWAVDPSSEDRSKGLSTHSSGNTAKALGYVANRFGVSARSLMPDSVPRSKVEAVEQYGVVPIQVPIEDLIEFVFKEHWKNEPFAFLNPWAEPRMLAGNATIGREILSDLPDISTVFIPVGGGGLIAGVASALKAHDPNIQVVAVQPTSCAPLRASFDTGSPVWVEPVPSICDATAVPLVIDESFSLLSEIIDEIVIVTDEEVRAAISQLASQHKLIVEGSGAMSLAAALAMPLDQRGKSICLLTGGSIGMATLANMAN